QLLARDLGGSERQSEVGKVILGEVPRAGRNVLGAPLDEVLHAIALEGGDHEGRFEAKARVQFFGKLEQVLATDGVDLVEDEHLGVADVGQPLNKRIQFRRQTLFGINDKGNDVGVPCPAPGALDHGAVEPALGGE